MAHPSRFSVFRLIDCSHVLKEQLLGGIDVICTNAHSFTRSLRFVQAPTLIRSAHSLAMYPSEDASWLELWTAQRWLAPSLCAEITFTSSGNTRGKFFLAIDPLSGKFWLSRDSDISSVKPSFIGRFWNSFDKIRPLLLCATSASPDVLQFALSCKFFS